MSQELGFAINRGNSETPVSPVAVRKLRDNAHIRGFIVYPEADYGEVLIEWVEKDWTLWPEEVLAVLESAAREMNIVIYPQPTQLVRTFVDWIGYPPAMSFEFGKGGQVDTTCARKFSPGPVLEGELGLWLFFVQCYTEFLRTGVSFWVGDDTRQPMDPIPDWVLEAVGDLDAKKGFASTPPRRPLLSRLGAWRSARVVVRHESVPGPGSTMIFYLSRCRFLCDRAKQWRETRAWVASASRKSLCRVGDGRISYFDVIGEIQWLVSVSIQVEVISEGPPELFPEIEFGKDPVITITVYGEPDDLDVNSLRLF
jgi:hypothetical protein